MPEKARSMRGANGYLVPGIYFDGRPRRKFSGCGSLSAGSSNNSKTLHCNTEAIFPSESSPKFTCFRSSREIEMRSNPASRARRSCERPLRTRSFLTFQESRSRGVRLSTSLPAPYRRLLQQIAGFYGKNFGQTGQYFNAGAVDTSLQGTDIGAINVSLVGKLLL